DDKSLCIARRLISDKIHNSRVLLRRNAKESKETLKKLRLVRGSAELATSKSSLLGHEGDAARVYWAEYSQMVAESDERFEMKGRSRRPPKDATNAMLSLGYSMLVKDCTRALM